MILAMNSVIPIIDLTDSPTISRQAIISQPIASLQHLLQDTIPYQHPNNQHTVPKGLQQSATPFVMTFSASGVIIRSPQRSTVDAIASTSINSLSQDSEITILEV